MQENEFDKTMTDIPSAEAGEHEAARYVLKEPEQIQQKNNLRGKAGKPVLSMVIFGLLSLSLYAVLLLKQDLIMDVYTRGGLYTAWPIGTALLFSFVHGAFASNFLSVLGIEAKKH